MGNSIESAGVAVVEKFGFSLRHSKANFERLFRHSAMRVGYKMCQLRKKKNRLAMNHRGIYLVVMDGVVFTIHPESAHINCLAVQTPFKGGIS